jgi:hypothetical protein
MCNRLLRSFGGLAVFCAVLALATPSYAQKGFGFRIQFGDRDRNVRAVGLINQAENRSDRFAAMLSGQENFLSEQARELASQLDVVRSEANNGASFYDVRSNVASALNIARTINREMRNGGGMGFQAERQWSMLRSDLNGLARAYNLGGIGYGGY